MVGLLTFAVVLVVAVLLSKIAHRTVLSTAAVFLVAGFIAGRGVMGVVVMDPRDPIVARLVELALVAVLFVEGMQLSLRSLLTSWRLPAQALLVGMPLTIVATAAIAKWLTVMSWAEALLIGSVLAPTDPVFAKEIVARREVPERLRHFLNVESGLNDGLALPAVVILLAVVGKGHARPLVPVGEIALGVVLGIVLPWAVLQLKRLKGLGAAPGYEALLAFAIGLLVLGTSSLLHANDMLAMFVAGLTISTCAPEVRDDFKDFGEAVAELLKLAALLVFGALLRPEALAGIGWEGWGFAVLALVVVRPAALMVALFGPGPHLSWAEWVAAAWFGPRGFASVFFSLLILQQAVPNAEYLAGHAAAVIALSMIAHSSTDVLVARWFEKRSAEEDEGVEAREGPIPGTAP